MTSFLQSDSSFLQSFDQSLLDSSVFDQSLQEFLKSSDLTLGDLLKANFSAPPSGSDGHSTASSSGFSDASSVGPGPIARPIRGAGQKKRDVGIKGYGMGFGSSNALDESFSSSISRPGRSSTAMPPESMGNVSVNDFYGMANNSSNDFHGMTNNGMNDTYGVANNSMNDFHGLDLSFTSVPPPNQRLPKNGNVGGPISGVVATSGSPGSNYPFRSPLITSPPAPLPSKPQGRAPFLEKLNRSDSSQGRPFSGGSRESAFDNGGHSYGNNGSNHCISNSISYINNNNNNHNSYVNKVDFVSARNFGSLVPPSNPPPAAGPVAPNEDNPIVNSLIGLSALKLNDKPNNLVGIKQWTHRDLVATVLKDVMITVQWLTDRRLLVGGRTCPRCGPLVRLEMAHCQRTRHWQTYDQLAWICKNCESSTYLRQGSFFDRPFNVSIISYVEIIYWWARCMPIEQIAEQTRTRQNFVTLMVCLLREVCAFEVGECRLIQGGIKAAVSLDNKRGQFKLNKVSCDDYIKSLEPAEAMWRLKFGFNAFECVLVHIATMYRCG